MNLAVSNVAWYHNRIDDFIGLISRLGSTGIELAPSMIWQEPVSAPYDERMQLKRKIQDAGLQLTGIQALLYSRQDLVLFGDAKKREEMLNYMTGMMDVCHDLGGDVMVFGSPRNRMIGTLNPQKARDIAVGFFRSLGMRAEQRNINFLIEPLGRSETDFINTVSDAYGFIQEAGHPSGLGLHIDTKGIIDEHEVEAPYMTEMFALAKHVHISEPGLKPVGSSGFDHRLISRIIRKSGYSRFVSIEMRRVDYSVEKTLEDSVNYVKSAYFGGKA